MAESPEHLVETSWVAEHLDDPGVRVVEVSARLTSSLQNLAEEDYRAGHIPGSVFPEAALPWTWPDPARIDEAMASVGVDQDTVVVLVGRSSRPGIDAGTMWCTRAWWTLHHSGVRCVIMRGGIERWVAEGRPMTDVVPEVPTGTFSSTDGRRTGCASKDDVLAALADGDACVLDALPATSFDGSGDGYGPRKGHITGAVNVPFHGLVDGETANFPDTDELRARIDAVVPAREGRIVTYCGGAIAATVPAFVLSLLGHDDVAVYDGSLMEWSTDPGLPMTDPSAR